MGDDGVRNFFKDPYNLFSCHCIGLVLATCGGFLPYLLCLYHVCRDAFSQKGRCMTGNGAPFPIVLPKSASTTKLSI